MPGTTLTIKSRPLADGRVRWWLYFRPALADGTSLLPVEGYDCPEDRPHVEAFAARYRAGMRKLRSEPKPEDCDRYVERYTEYQRECGSTDAEKKATRWRKWISPRIGHKRPRTSRARTSKTCAMRSTPRSSRGSPARPRRKAPVFRARPP